MCVVTFIVVGGCGGARGGVVVVIAVAVVVVVLTLMNSKPTVHNPINFENTRKQCKQLWFTAAIQFMKINLFRKMLLLLVLK